jgi:hypothetical protein
VFLTDRAPAIFVRSRWPTARFHIDHTGYASHEPARHVAVCRPDKSHIRAHPTWYGVRFVSFQRQGRLEAIMNFAAADEVAVMPREAKSPADVLRISKVRFAGRLCIETNDGHVYAASDGKEFVDQMQTYIVPATAEHRAAIRRRASQISHSFLAKRAGRPRTMCMSGAACSPPPSFSSWSSYS